MLMPVTKGAKTRKHSKKRDHQHEEHEQKTRHHSNLRPKHKNSKDFLKVYYPYLPLVTVLIMILAVIQPWQSRFAQKQGVLPYATEMSVTELAKDTNARREKQHLGQLTLNKKLSEAAQAKANDMVKRDYWSHSTPEGNAPWQFITDANYLYRKAGENLAYGFTNDNEVIAGWMNSKSHRDNLLDPNYKNVGFGFAQSKDYIDQGPTTVVVAMYGQPSASAKVASVKDASPDSYNTLGATQEPGNYSIRKVQSITSGLAPWSPYAVGAILGALIMFLVFKHGRALRKSLVRGEHYAMKHPLVDVTIMSIIALGAVISQQIGVIR